MGGLGGSPVQPGSEIKVDLKSRLLERIVGLIGALIPGAALAIVLAGFTLLRQQPQNSFDLLRQWGAWWIVSIAAGYWIWTFAMRLIDELRRLGTGVQDSAVAITRLADRDDRDRDRMLTETAFVGSTVQKLGVSVTEMREQLTRVERALVRKDGG
jgi:hypothetical protein